MTNGGHPSKGETKAAVTKPKPQPTQAKPADKARKQRLIESVEATKPFRCEHAGRALIHIAMPSLSGDPLIAPAATPAPSRPAIRPDGASRGSKLSVRSFRLRASARATYPPPPRTSRLTHTDPPSTNKHPSLVYLRYVLILRKMTNRTQTIIISQKKSPDVKNTSGMPDR